MLSFFAANPTGPLEGLVDSVVTPSCGEQTTKKRQNEFVKVTGAGEMLGVSQGIVRAWAEAGKLPVRRNPANGYRLFKKKDLVAFLKSLDRAERSRKTRD